LFVNAGINSQLSYNVLQRIDQVVKCNPDFITILIGTNDAAATLNEKNAARYVKKQNLPRVPHRHWYEENLQNRDGQMKSSYVAGESGLMYKAIFSRYILGQSWDEIAEKNNFIFLTDNLHLNRRGALMATELIDDFLAVSQ